MSPRRLLGWEPGEVTTFEYDKSGRVVSSVTVREAEFSAWDLALLLADRADGLRPRGRHGVPISEATDPENAYAFRVAPPITDFVQQALNREQETYKKMWPDADMSSLLWSIER